MSRRNVSETDKVMIKVDNTSKIVAEVSEHLTNKYLSDLDNQLDTIRNRLNSQEIISDDTLEHLILDLANSLYFACSAQEDLGIKEDTCKAIRQEVFNKAREQAKGTVADKDMAGTLASQTETITLAIYSRAYKKVKLKVEAGYEMLNSLKKVMNKRITEMELSQSRYMGGQPDERIR
jgi:hypothetical protein